MTSQDIEKQSHPQNSSSNSKSRWKTSRKSHGSAEEFHSSESAESSYIGSNLRLEQSHNETEVAIIEYQGTGGICSMSDCTTLAHATDWLSSSSSTSSGTMADDAVSVNKGSNSIYNDAAPSCIQMSHPSTLSSFLQNNNKKREVPSPDDEDNDDESEVTTTPYYEPSDFNAANWLKALDAPTVGLAVVALATAITHPLLFVAGALTASAAGMGYDYFFVPHPSRQTGQASSESSLVKWLFCFNYNTTIDDTKPLAVTADSNALQITSPLITQSAPSHKRADTDETSTAASSSESTDVSSNGQPSLNEFDQHFHDSQDSKFVGGHATQRVEDLTDVADIEAWIDLHYPPLEVQIVDQTPFIGLNVIEFFQVFFADHAPYNFLEFQKKRGDKSIIYGPWEQIGTEISAPLSMHPKSLPDQSLNAEAYSYQARNLSFLAKTNSFFGPPYATTTKDQRILIISKRCAILESKTVLQDIPFCDKFYVLERWTILAEKDETDERYTSYVSSFCEAVFTEKCPFENQIRSKSKSTVAEIMLAWTSMAQQALKLAEKAKQDRLKNSSERDDEIAFTEKNKQELKEDKRSQEDKSMEDQSVEIQHSDLPETNCHDLMLIDKVRSDTTGIIKRTISNRLSLDSIRRSVSAMGSGGNHWRRGNALKSVTATTTSTCNEESTLQTVNIATVLV